MCLVENIQAMKNRHDLPPDGVVFPIAINHH